MLEKLRLSAWKKNLNTEKNKEKKEEPKITENNVSSVTKGVKFAVSTFILFFYWLYSCCQSQCDYG